MSSPHLWRGFCEILDTLVSHGVPRPSDRWLAEAERFYLHPTARTWFACVGRGGGKNLVGILCDITEVVFGDAVVPPGERHYQVNVGENREEAEKTLAQTAQYLSMLGIPFAPYGGTLDLGGELADRGIKVLACRIGAVSGFRSTGATAQETAKWNDDGRNPAEEVATSIAAQTVTHPSARQRYFATPLGRLGFFFDGYAAGETSDQIVTHGASWEFNPTITEAQCWKLARGDRRTFDREYRAIPQAGALSAFDADAIECAFRSEPGTPSPRLLFIDASSGRSDRFTWAFGGWVREPGRPAFLKIESIHAADAQFWGKVTGAEIVATIAEGAKARHVREVHGDQRESMMLASEFARHGLHFNEHPWTASSKPVAVERVRRWLADRLVVLPEHEDMRRELLSFEERILPSGQFTYGARTGHDDFCALLVTAALADAKQRLSLHGTQPYSSASVPATHTAGRTFVGDDMFDEDSSAAQQRRGCWWPS